MIREPAGISTLAMSLGQYSAKSKLTFAAVQKVKGSHPFEAQ
jgi:hypothetical protein